MTRPKDDYSYIPRVIRARIKIETRFQKLADTIPLNKNMFDDPRVQRLLKRGDAVDQFSWIATQRNLKKVTF